MTKNTSHKKEEDGVLNSIKLSRIIPPTILGLSVVAWMMYRQLDIEDLKAIQWSNSATFWVIMAVLSYIIRHLFYSWRLRIMTDEEFSWPKSIQLITLWEFASAVSPTTVGGSGVALFMLAQEKLSTAKAVSVVLYSMVLDTVFFIVTLPILYFIIGAEMIRPGMQSLTDLDRFGYTFIGVLVFMTAYGALFWYGLFVNPKTIKRVLLFLSKWRILGRFKESLRTTALDVVSTAKEIQVKPFNFHIKSITATSGAWIFRFIAINCIILAFVSSTPTDIMSQLLIYARGENMHVTTSFTPTPGGAGVAEYLFGGYFSDYVPRGIASLLALVWRIITYYTYLLAGALIIPFWIRSIMNNKKKTSLHKRST